MSEPAQSSALQFLGEPQSGRAEEQQLAARELVEAVGQLLREAILHDESTESWWGDRLRAFAEAVLGLREDGVVTDDQALELLTLFLGQIGEAEVSQITSDLLDASLETVGRHIYTGIGDSRLRCSGRRLRFVGGFGYGKSRS